MAIHFLNVIRSFIMAMGGFAIGACLAVGVRWIKLSLMGLVDDVRPWHVASITSFGSLTFLYICLDIGATFNRHLTWRTPLAAIIFTGFNVALIGMWFYLGSHRTTNEDYYGRY